MTNIISFEDRKKAKEAKDFIKLRELHVEADLGVGQSMLTIYFSDNGNEITRLLHKYTDHLPNGEFQKYIEELLKEILIII